MFTDRQVALLAAGGDVDRAKKGFSWLMEGRRQDSAPSTPQNARPQGQDNASSPAAETAQEPPRRLEPVVDRDKLVADVRAAVLREANGDGVAARNWCIERWGDGFTTLENVVSDDLQGALRELSRSSPRRAG